MIRGPMSLRLVGAFLGKTEAGMRTLIEEDALPVVRVPGEKRLVEKVYFTPFHQWLNKLTTGSAMTVEQLEQELERCQAEILRKDEVKRGRKVKAVEAMNALNH